MVSAKMIVEIKRKYQALSNKRIDIHQYSGPLFDVAFEITSADSFVAGVASKLLDRDSITREERILISTQVLLDGRLWRRDSGELFDLHSYAEIKDLAVSIENLRAICYEALSS